MSVDAKIMTVVGAIKQSIEQSAGPGMSVNSHPNPFFVNVNGSMDLKHAATLILQRIEAYEEAAKTRLEKEAAALKAEASKLFEKAPTAATPAPDTKKAERN